MSLAPGWCKHVRLEEEEWMNAKRWGLVFRFLSSRAIHIVVLETVDFNAFICALRSFFALRGHTKLLRCDRGTNFVGAKTELDAAASELDEKKVEKFVTECGCKWEFNPPHASHFGGHWVRPESAYTWIVSYCERQADSSAAVRHRWPAASVPCNATHYEDTPSRTPSRPFRVDRYLRAPSMETSPVPCWTILDQVEERILPEPTVAIKLDGDAAGPVRRRYRSCARLITTP